jgi:hypothetical protein
MLALMSFLLPRELPGTVGAARAVEIHGDRYVDLTVAFDELPGEPWTGRMSAIEIPDGLAPGDRVTVRLVMGVATSVRRS